MDFPTEFKIFQQSDIIDDFMTHLLNGSMGIAMARDWFYRREGNTIIFTLKPGHTPKLDVLIWFGFYTRD
ncbi:hypothetical protein [Epilithonimonas arachidiradicis]|uniref:Uncharacterized protein n=1 Tax=Epilithonimonas arachidiradicis TaxID=1617282 RepID=A0A420DEP1_9FLAO|nr:hypothetical protein [Epilithonimonas arachidiradicis]RKE90029.1 hypothetical protein BXY58_0614 [Epilithonimonas arachidiradicis]GGG47197.1 hypothetical protein GCM10007332_05870 [Epilithonimonas arachidiradicis]